MLKRVFNGINYAILETTPTTQAQRNQYNEVNTKVQKLKDMVSELNRLHTNNEPMFVHYRLDTRARIEHFFAQSWVETWAGQLRLAESISKENANKNYNKYGNRPNTDDGYNFRGRGLLHLTFRDNYHACTRYLHNQGWLSSDINFEAQPQLVTDSGVYALLSAVWVWNTYRINEQNLYNIAENQDIIRAQYSFTKNRNGTGGTITLNNVSQNLRLITERINGCYNNLAERQQIYTRVKNAEIFKDFE